MTVPGKDPGSLFLRVAAGGAAVTVVLMSAANGLLMDTGIGNFAELLVGALLGIAAVTLFSVVIAGLAVVVGSLPVLAFATFAGALLALWFLSSNSIESLMRALLDVDSWAFPLSWPDSLSPLALATVAIAIGMLAGVVAILNKRQFRDLRLATRVTLLGFVTVFAALAIAVVFDLVRDGRDPFDDDVDTLAGNGTLPELPDPSERGQFSVEHLTYGSGANLRRSEFGANRDLESRQVDASALLPDWKGLKKKMRERFWGFGLEQAPLNGQVWAPARDAGGGPYPLVLIVHGNHGMEDYSDAGYAYLGELLASRGFIAVSVDENFINGTWSGDFRGKEMPLRAWLLLEHLRLWHEWNGRADHRFGGAVDVQNLALVGHSRGGEAVSIAHAFNALPHYPDDATVVFDFGFNIRSLVAIAQVDQRYQRRVEIENVNFFTIHGSYDSDEPAYHGLRQRNRINLNDGNYWINAGVYIHGANHGQFNTDWGRADVSPPAAWLLNLAPIIPAEEQRQAAQVFIVAFLEATLRGQTQYADLLRDIRVGAEWLPELPYMHQFTDSTFAPIADFEEDLDVTTGTTANARIRADGFALWREEDLEHRDERKQGSNVVVLGWKDNGNGAAVYRMQSDTPLTGDSLSFSVSGSMERIPIEDNDNTEDPEADMLDAQPRLPNFTVEVADGNANAGQLTVAENAYVSAPVRVRYLKNAALNEELYQSNWEAVLQHVELDFERFRETAPQLDVNDIREIRFRFNQDPEGVVIIDNIGTLTRHRVEEEHEPTDDQSR